MGNQMVLPSGKSDQLISCHKLISGPHRPHLGARREPVKGQLIHRTVYWATDQQYKKCLPPEWQDENNKEQIEPDEADQVALRLWDFVNKLGDFSSSDDERAATLEQLNVFLCELPSIGMWSI